MFIVKIESFEENEFLAYIDNIKGMVVQANSPQNAAKELLKSLKLKIAYDYNFEFDFDEEEVIEFIQHVKEGENKINFIFC